MTINREHLKGLELAKEILGGYTADQVSDSPYIAITDAIAQAQAAPEAEPVAQVMGRVHHNPDHIEPVRAVLNSIGRQLPDNAPLYTAPQHDAELVELLRASVGLIRRGDFDTGYCCCGGQVDRHGMSDGHSPVDEGGYCASQLAERIDAKLATLSAKP